MNDESCFIRTVPLGDVATIKTGNKPKEIKPSGDYEYINAGTTASGFADDTNCQAGTITTPSRGQGGIGYIGYQPNDFWLGPLCYGIRSNTGGLRTKYLYYYLSSKKQLVSSLKKEGGTPAVNLNELKQISVQIPPLDEQKKITAILDKFDSLCNDLSDGLPAEIEARQKQYEYYRDKLLSFKRKDEA